MTDSHNATPYVTYIIIAANVIISFIGFSNTRLIEKNLFSVKGVLRDKQLYRLFTSQFFHANWAHLLFNMFSFYSFAIILERLYGPITIAIIYLLSALGGDVLALAMKRKDPHYRAIGASGAVSGIIYASIFFYPETSLYIFPVPIAIPGWLFAIGFVLVSLYGIGRGSSIIGHEAHLGGALTGILCAVYFRPSIVHEQWILLLVLAVPVLVLLLFFMRK